jgi:cyclopropane-fatty-acyl-phospholipid synthase
MTRTEEVLAHAGIKINGTGSTDILLASNHSIEELFESQLSFGETYMDEIWSTPDLPELMCKFHEHKVLHKLTRDKSHPRYHEAQERNLQDYDGAYESMKHYDISNEMYEAMLGETMAYTCGLWDTHLDSLDIAQYKKFRRIAETLNFQPGQTVLDVGCGWGTAAKYFHDNYGIRVVGVTLSEEQWKYAVELNKGTDNSILLQDYRKVKGKFDHIYSIGFLEHIGFKNYRTYFKKCYSLLNGHGKVLTQTATAATSHALTTAWWDKYITPNGQLPSMAQIAQSAETLFVFDDYFNMRDCYIKTLTAWRENFLKTAPSLGFDTKFIRMMDFYLSTPIPLYKFRDISIGQWIHVKKGGTVYD